jgi:hypothetical protein
LALFELRILLVDDVEFPLSPDDLAIGRSFLD